MCPNWWLPSSLSPLVTLSLLSVSGSLFLLSMFSQLQKTFLKQVTQQQLYGWQLFSEANKENHKKTRK